jgi:hypothetical protein
MIKLTPGRRIGSPTVAHWINFSSYLVIRDHKDDLILTLLLVPMSIPGRMINHPVLLD